MASAGHGHQSRLLLRHGSVKKISTFAVNDPENRATSDSIGAGEIKRNSNKSKSTGPARGRSTCRIKSNVIRLSKLRFMFLYIPET